MPLALATLGGCFGPPRCPPGRACGVATWLPTNTGSAIEGRLVNAPASSVAGTGADLGRSEALALRAEPVYLRFDLSALRAGARVEHAVLALSPHPAWRPTGVPVRILARAVLGPWTALSVPLTGAPSLSDELAAQAILPGRARTPLRLDVTEAVRAWQRGAPSEGLALSVEGPEVVFAGAGAANALWRPRLEVVVR